MTATRRGALVGGVVALFGAAVGGPTVASDKWRGWDGPASGKRKPPKPTPTSTATPTPTSTPTVTPAPTPTGGTWQTMFTEDFSAGNFHQWQSCQWPRRNDNCQTYDGTSDYSASIVGGAARFELRPSDTPPFGSNPRSEIAEPLGSALYVREGEEWRFAWDMMFDPNFARPVGNWCIPWQWHGSGPTSSPPLCLDIDTDDVVYLANNNSVGYQRTPVRQVPRDGWHRWEVHTKFSATAGFAEVLLDGSVVVPWHARKTMVAGESYNYFKCGLYESPAETATRVVWHDNLLWSKAA